MLEKMIFSVKIELEIYNIISTGSATTHMRVELLNSNQTITKIYSVTCSEQEIKYIFPYKNKTFMYSNISTNNMSRQELIELFNKIDLPLFAAITKLEVDSTDFPLNEWLSYLIMHFEAKYHKYVLEDENTSLVRVMVSNNLPTYVIVDENLFEPSVFQQIVYSVPSSLNIILTAKLARKLLTDCKFSLLSEIPDDNVYLIKAGDKNWLGKLASQLCDLSAPEIKGPPPGDTTAAEVADNNATSVAKNNVTKVAKNIVTKVANTDHKFAYQCSVGNKHLIVPPEIIAINIIPNGKPVTFVIDGLSHHTFTSEQIELIRYIGDATQPHATIRFGPNPFGRVVVISANEFYYNFLSEVSKDVRWYRPADTQYIVPGCNLTLYRRIKHGISGDKIINQNTAVQKHVISEDKEYCIEWFNEASSVLEF